jgi:hypothetical protein
VPDDPRCPEAILAAIPWYPEGLTPDECGAVEAHAADCRACCAELAFLRGDEEPAISLPDAEQVYQRVLERIAGPGGDAESSAEWATFARARSIGRRAAKPVGLAAGLMVAALSGMLTTGAIWVARVAPTYEAQPVPTVAVAAPGVAHLDVIFRPETTASEIQSALSELDAKVISGPTQVGAYRLRLAPGSDVSAGIARLLEGGRGVAIFAEPAGS